MILLLLPLLVMALESKIQHVDAFQTKSIIAPVQPKYKSCQSARSATAFGADDASTTVPKALDWTFLDGIYIITCPNADPGSARLNEAKRLLSQVNLLEELQVKSFATDDEDRIRGCYTSHISVIRDALRDLKKSRQEEGNPFQAFFLRKGEQASAGNGKILILEDNLALTGSLDQSMIDAISAYVENDTNWDMVHLSYIPYVPNLVVTRTDNEKIVQLSCGIGSALGTTAYIINEESMKRVLAQDDGLGYYAPIPDVMAEIFPDTRYAAFPTPFVRAPKTKSLVNPQLDDLREILFQPVVTSQVQKVLAISGLSTNALLPTTIAALLLLTAISGKESIDAVWSIVTTGTYDGPIVLVVLSLAFTIFSLAVLAQGAMLAPKSPQTADVVKE